MTTPKQHETPSGEAESPRCEKCCKCGKTEAESPEVFFCQYGDDEIICLPCAQKELNKPEVPQAVKDLFDQWPPTATYQELIDEIVGLAMNHEIDGCYVDCTEDDLRERLLVLAATAYERGRTSR
jgi:hypothetical protein